MVKLVTVALTALVATSSASIDGEEPPTVMQDVDMDMEGDRTINLVTDVMVRT